MDMNGKALMMEFEGQQQEVDFLQFTPEFDGFNMESHVNIAADSLDENITFARIPAVPKPAPLPPSPPPVLNPATAQFLFKKVLKTSDVGQGRRIIIPKAFAENCLPNLTDGDGIFLYMDDMDAPHVWVFRFRYWQNSHSKMYVLEKTGDFVKAHGLGAGDLVIIYKDELTKRYGIRAKKDGANETVPTNGANASMNYYGDFVQRDDIGTNIYPGHNMMNFLGGPELTLPNDEQSMGFDPANGYPDYYF